MRLYSATKKGDNRFNIEICEGKGTCKKKKVLPRRRHSVHEY